MAENKTKRNNATISFTDKTQKEEIQAILHPLANGNLMAIEYRACNRRERTSAGLTALLLVWPNRLKDDSEQYGQSVGTNALIRSASPVSLSTGWRS